jgi:DNA-binding CsgD family transcriptional regulator
MAEEGLALVPEATTAGEARDRVSLLSTIGLVRLWRSDEPGAREVLEEAARLALEHHDDVGASRANNQLSNGNLLLLSTAEAIERVRVAIELAARHGLHTMQAYYLACQTFLTTRAGAWDETRRLIDEAEALLDPEDPSEFTRWILAEARADLALGEADLAGSEAARLALLERALSVESEHFAGYARDGAAVARMLAGDPPAARALLEPELARFLMLIEQGAAEAEVLMPKVQVLVAAGEEERARPLVAWGLGVLPDHPQIRYCAALLGLRDEPDAAAAEVEATAAGTEERGWTFVAACDRVAAAGIAAQAGGGRPAAVALLRAARERFGGIGCEGWVRRVDESLRRLGERAPTRAGAGVGGLSARELEVLALVAEGLTNRQIAERLVISEHTAIRHVANLTRKLGVRNRAAAARVGAERGLIGAPPEG